MPNSRQRVVIVDDLLATGGTSRCNVELVKKLKGEARASCILWNLP